MNITPLRWITRTLVLVFTVWFFFWYTVFGIGSVVTDLHGQVTAAIISEIVFGILLLTAYVFSWWKENIGGVLFIVTSVGATLLELVNLLQHPVSGWGFSRYIENIVDGWTRLGFPLLLVGVLLLIVWRMSKAERAQVKT